MGQALHSMAISVVKFSREGYKIRKYIFCYRHFLMISIFKSLYFLKLFTACNYSNYRNLVISLDFSWFSAKNLSNLYLSLLNFCSNFTFDKKIWWLMNSHFNVRSVTNEYSVILHKIPDKIEPTSIEWTRSILTS